MSDQHRYSSLGHREDGDPVSTPTLDRLVADGSYLDNAYCAFPICTPSRLCMLTGKQAPDAGAWDNKSVLLPDHETLPQTLSDAGYETCLVGKMHLGGTRQFVGFDHRPYGDITGQAGHQFEPPANGPGDFTRKSIISDAGVSSIPESLLQEQNVINESVSFLREMKHRAESKPWFLCASLSRPHWPRTAPPRFFERFWPEGVSPPKIIDDGDVPNHPLTEHLAEAYKSNEVSEEETLRARAGYFACVEYLDEIIGDFLQLLEQDGLLEDTIVIYASDHGDMLGDVGLWDKVVWHDLSTRVPWVIQLPEHRSGNLAPSHIETPVSLIDIYPTLCGLVDVEVPSGLGGCDLSAALERGREPTRDPVYVDNFRDESESGLEYRMARDGPYKYVHFRKADDLFFNLDEDSFETNNLVGTATGQDKEEMVRLRDRITEDFDFEEAFSQREKDEMRAEDYRLGIGSGTGNAYHFPDGRVVDADTPLYHPNTVIDDPTEVFDDRS